MSRFLRGVAVCVVLAMPILAQFDTAQVLGTVRDQSGAEVSKAKITLLNVDTGISVTATFGGKRELHFF